VTFNAHANRVVGSGTGVENVDDASMDVENNWWGCNEGPNQAGCVPANGTPDFDPWLVLGLSASPTSISPGGDTSTITADLTKNSNGETVGSAFPETDVFFSTTLGSIDPFAPTSNGIATATLTSDATEGSALVNALLDSESQGVSVDIGTPPATPPPPPSTTASTGQRALALQRCKKKKKGSRARKRCKRRARRLPV
jgi:hypothetical protein